MRVLTGVTTDGNLNELSEDDELLAAEVLLYIASFLLPKPTKKKWWAMQRVSLGHGAGAR